MYILYLDDSGSGADPNQKHFVLGGIIIHESNAQSLTGQLENIAAKINPKNSKSIELHAAVIWTGREEPWESLCKSHEDKKNKIKEILNCANNTPENVVCLATAIHKSSFDGEDYVQKAYEDISSRFHQYIKKRNKLADKSEKGIIIIDKSSGESGMQSLSLEIREKGNKWGINTRNIIEVPLFVDSKASRIIQLADHIAYAVFRRYDQEDLTYYNVIQNKFDKSETEIFGLCHLTKDKNCTCPYCITKKIKRAGGKTPT